MYCHKCGNETKGNDRFCIKCGNHILSEKTIKNPVISEDKWYLRLAKVIYIALYIPLPFVLFGVWTLNQPYCYYEPCVLDGEAFWYTLLTLVVWVVILRLIKIAVLYVFTAQKPKWKIEFKRFF